MKILIAHYNRTLAKLIHDKISSSTECEVDIVHTLEGAKEYLNTHTPLLAILDLYLPDAMENEVIDYFLTKSIPSIIISTENDPYTYKILSKKNIIDYLIIQNIESINYLSSLIKRIKNNRNHNILVVDDSLTYRKLMVNTLKNQLFNVSSVSSAEEAIEFIQTNKDIQIVLTDYHMPKMNGMELTIKLRKQFPKNKLSIIGISSDKDSSVNFLKYGANDFIKKPFVKEELNCRVNNTVESLENIDKLYHYSYTDFLTQIPNRKYFFDHMNNFFKKAQKENKDFCIAMLDIDHFKKVNDTYGHDIGDIVIKTLANTLKNNITHIDLVARFGGEEFCIVLKNRSKQEALEFFKKLNKTINNIKIDIDDNKTISFTTSTGLCTQKQQTLQQMINSADKLLYEAKNNGRNQVCSDIKELEAVD